MQKKKRRAKAFERYRESLRISGFESYEDYLRSSCWNSFNDWYRTNEKLPQHCLVCFSSRYVLHHINYCRVGEEWLNDVVPLCQECHENLHAWLAKNRRERLPQIKRHLIVCFGIDPKDASDRMNPFMAIRRDIKRAGNIKPNKYGRNHTPKRARITGLAKAKRLKQKKLESMPMGVDKAAILGRELLKTGHLSSF